MEKIKKIVAIFMAVCIGLNLAVVLAGGIVGGALFLKRRSESGEEGV